MDDVIAHRIALASLPPRDVCCGALSLWLGSTVLRRETLGLLAFQGQRARLARERTLSHTLVMCI